MHSFTPLYASSSSSALQGVPWNVLRSLRDHRKTTRSLALPFSPFFVPFSRSGASSSPACPFIFPLQAPPSSSFFVPSNLFFAPPPSLFPSSPSTLAPSPSPPPAPEVPSSSAVPSAAKICVSRTFQPRWQSADWSLPHTTRAPGLHWRSSCWFPLVDVMTLRRSLPWGCLSGRVSVR